MRKQKKMLARPFAAFAHFPAGFSQIALQEVQEILANPLMPTKFSAKLKVHKDKIHIQGIHYFQLVELLFRSRILTDLRLVLVEIASSSYSQWQKQLDAFAPELYFPEPSQFQCIFKSRNGFIGKQLKDSIQTYFRLTTAEEADFKLYCESYPKRSHLALSLAGDWLYKRGFRGSLAKSAPIREDIAAATLLQFKNFIGETLFSLQPYVYIPFAGTGTFLFEFFFLKYDLYPGILREHYSLQDSLFFREQHFTYLQQKADSVWQEKLIKDETTQVFCLEKQKETFTYLQEQVQHPKLKQWYKHFRNEKRLQVQQGDFFHLASLPTSKPKNNCLFIFLNPPYGKRMQTTSSIPNYYQKIAKKIREHACNFEKTCGFVYCPNASSSQAFHKELQAQQSQTFHFTHGGMDMRCYMFSL
ncbi:MAG: hypothetical protein AAF518_00935 [Spirochaetota bacterium]